MNSLAHSALVGSFLCTEENIPTISKNATLHVLTSSLKFCQDKTHFEQSKISTFRGIFNLC